MAERYSNYFNNAGETPLEIITGEAAGSFAPAGPAGPQGPAGPIGPAGPAANLLSLKGVLGSAAKLAQRAGAPGDAYLVGQELFAYSALSSKCESLGPVKMTGALAADPTGVAAYGEIYSDCAAGYRAEVTFPLKIKMAEQSPPFNLLYEPESAITVLDAGTYEITRRLSFRADPRNAVTASILRNGKEMPRSTLYSEGEAGIVDRDASYLAELEAGDVLEMWVASLRNSLKMTVYHASLLILRIG
jgi:hypothetical protein